MAPHGDDGQYHPVDALKAGMQGATVTGAAGIFAAAIKNATRKQNYGAMGIVTRSGGMIFTFSASNFPLRPREIVRSMRLLTTLCPSSCRRRRLRVRTQRSGQSAREERPLQCGHWRLPRWLHTGGTGYVVPNLTGGSGEFGG